MRLRLIERRISRFFAKPVSVRSAMGIIVWFMSMSVVLGGVIVWIFDRTDFPNVGIGLWWSLQTVTTVGYGDVVPTTIVGRVVGAVVMLEAIAFVSVLTAAITSSFVERARRQLVSDRETESGVDSLWIRLNELDVKLDRIEAAIHSMSKSAADE
jgi:voltage-gated potassium channel Kch